MATSDNEATRPMRLIANVSLLLLLLAAPCANGRTSVSEAQVPPNGACVPRGVAAKESLINATICLPNLHQNHKFHQIQNQIRDETNVVAFGSTREFSCGPGCLVRVPRPSPPTSASVSVLLDRPWREPSAALLAMLNVSDPLAGQIPAAAATASPHPTTTTNNDAFGPCPTHISDTQHSIQLGSILHMHETDFIPPPWSHNPTRNKHPSIAFQPTRHSGIPLKPIFYNDGTPNPISDAHLKHPHLDARFARPESLHVETLERTRLLRGVFAAWAEFADQHGIPYWIAHGSLIGWWWNGQVLPWDDDMDIQLNANMLYELAKHHGTMLRDRYVIEVNPDHIVRDHQQQSVIDARAIDTETGFFIDITGVSLFNPTRTTHTTTKWLSRWFSHTEIPNGHVGIRNTHWNGLRPRHSRVNHGQSLHTDPATTTTTHTPKKNYGNRRNTYEWSRYPYLACKRPHPYVFAHMFPLVRTVFEGVPTWVPWNPEAVLFDEYPIATTSPLFKGYLFDKNTEQWHHLNDCTSLKHAYVTGTPIKQLRKACWHAGIRHNIDWHEHVPVINTTYIESMSKKSDEYRYTDTDTNSVKVDGCMVEETMQRDVRNVRLSKLGTYVMAW